MIRLALETTDDIFTKLRKQANDIVTSSYDDIDAVLPEWADSPDDFMPSFNSTPKTKNTTYPAKFSQNSVLLNPVYSNYTYPKYSIYKG